MRLLFAQPVWDNSYLLRKATILNGIEARLYKQLPLQFIISN